MATNPNGWLPYGSDDDSILLQHPLTSDPTTYFGTISTCTVQGSGHTYDSVRGFCPSGAGGFRLVGLTGNSALDNAGQISFEVERDFLCEDNSTYYSSGYVPSTAEMVMSYSPTTGSAGVIGAKATNEQFYASGANLAGLASYVQSAGKSDFVTVNFGWSGGRVGGTCYMAIDGVVIDSASRNAATLAGAFATLYLGSDRGLANTFPRQHYIRNLQISTRPPMFAVHPLLRHVGMISDSMLNSDDVVNGNYKDAASSWQFRRELAKKGLYCGTVTVSVNGGHRLDDSLSPGSITAAASTTQFTSAGLFTNLPTAPFYIVTSGFTNPANNGTFLISAATASALTVSGATLTTEASAAARTFTYGSLVPALNVVLASNPTVVIIRGGTNDPVASRCSQSTWQDAVAAYITACMAVSSVRRVIFLGIPSAVGSTSVNTATFKSERATGESKIQAAVDAWRAANHSDTRDVIFADDIYSRLGGESPAAGTYVGQVAGTYADLHLSGYGHYLHGKAMADWVIKELGTA